MGAFAGRLGVDLLVQGGVLDARRRPGLPAARRAEAEPGHQLRPDRSSEQAAAHQPEGGGRHRQRDGAGEVVLLLHQLAERGAGAVPARHGDRAGDEAEQRIDAERRWRGPPRRRSAAPRGARRAPRRCRTCLPPILSSPRLAPSPMAVKKAIMNGDCSRGVELEGQDAGLPERQGDGGEDEPAHHRGGDVEPVQHADLAPDAVPGKEDERGERDRLHHVQRHGGGHRWSGVRERERSA